MRKYRMSKGAYQKARKLAIKKGSYSEAVKSTLFAELNKVYYNGCGGKRSNFYRDAVVTEVKEKRLAKLQRYINRSIYGVDNLLGAIATD